ncbi:DUF1963 domain-containing protein [Hamadaea sp. NPDC051192]|uniref:DUF1963 domain-containing protein n=1 Tax=Hamadaea sp. NPDC051192 TaxID=3154940 RepID=UPI003417C829
MDLRAKRAELSRLCAEVVGESVGAQLAALARPAFQLRPAAAGQPATGRSALGGPALLDPGTPWPHHRDVPLSLAAVLDTDTLADVLGEPVPWQTGLLNFFVYDPVPDHEWDADLTSPGWARVIAAHSDRAVERTAPEPADSYERIAIDAAPVLTLPDQWDDAVNRLDRGPHRQNILGLELHPLYEQWGEVDGHAAFGWPAWELGPSPSWADDHLHLLKLRAFPFDGTLYVSVPAAALQSGDLSAAVATLETY